jgi:hypothetical protein
VNRAWLCWNEPLFVDTEKQTTNIHSLLCLVLLWFSLVLLPT